MKCCVMGVERWWERFLVVNGQECPFSEVWVEVDFLG